VEDPDVESLTLRFLPGSVPIQQRWRNNGLSADFLADYVSTFFPLVENDPGSARRIAEMTAAVKFIANELLENGMKYAARTAHGPIAITLQLNQHSICFWESNRVEPDQLAQFKAFAQDVATQDPADLYMQQLEKSAEGQGSGLGFLTMINDYGAQLGWQFDTTDPIAQVTTFVSLTI
jgi:hypothetical protein